MKPMLKAPGTKRLKLKYDEVLSNFPFKIDLRRYNAEPGHRYPVRIEYTPAKENSAFTFSMVGRCRLNRSNPH